MSNPYPGVVGFMQSRRKTREVKEENVTLGPTVREGEHVFGVAHIFASFNDTFIVSFHRFTFLFSVSPLLLSYHIPNGFLMDVFSFNLQHVTDLSGRETLVRITGIRMLLICNIIVAIIIAIALCLCMHLHFCPKHTFNLHVAGHNFMWKKLHIDSSIIGLRPGLELYIVCLDDVLNKFTIFEGFLNLYV